jgi:hypothetical protein
MNQSKKTKCVRQPSHYFLAYVMEIVERLFFGLRSTQWMYSTKQDKVRHGSDDEVEQNEIPNSFSDTYRVLRPFLGWTVSSIGFSTVVVDDNWFSCSIHNELGVRSNS